MIVVLPSQHQADAWRSTSRADDAAGPNRSFQGCNGLYQPFIDDPKDIKRLEGQRYVVLRPTGGVPDVHRQVRALAKERLAGCDVSFPARAHVTLTGFAAGTDLHAIRELVADWARTIAPLSIEVERVNHFPSPFQIVIVQVRKTVELFEALASLRERESGRTLKGLSPIPAADWVFHMSVAYCSSLSVSNWTGVSQFFDTLAVPAARCVVSEAEIVAFDKGTEYSGGVFELSMKTSRSHETGSESG